MSRIHRDVPRFDPDADTWKTRAACRDTSDPDAWFDYWSGPEKHVLDTCRACPVRGQCLQHAIERGENYGIWGGTTEQQRRRLVNQLHQGGQQ